MIGNTGYFLIVLIIIVCTNTSFKINLKENTLEYLAVDFWYKQKKRWFFFKIHLNFLSVAFVLMPNFSDDVLCLVTQLCPTLWPRGLSTPLSVSSHTPLSVGFSRQEYWSGLPCSPPEGLPNPGIKPWLPYCRWSLYQLSYLESPFSDDTNNQILVTITKWHES